MSYATTRTREWTAQDTAQVVEFFKRLARVTGLRRRSRGEPPAYEEIPPLPTLSTLRLPPLNRDLRFNLLSDDEAHVDNAIRYQVETESDRDRSERLYCIRWINSASQDNPWKNRTRFDAR